MATAIVPHCAHCGVSFTKLITNPPTNKKFCSLDCRFWNKVDRSDDVSKCWEWKSKARGQFGYGYGAFSVNSKATPAHRVAWTLMFGEIPNGLFVCHKCDNPKCCNPHHFFLGTHRDNMLDMQSKGRNVMSPEGKERLRQSKLGKPRSPEVREKLRQAQLGKHLTQEAKDKISKVHLGRKRPASTIQKMKETWALRKQRDFPHLVDKT